MLFPEAPASYDKEIFLHCTSIYMSSKRVSQIFKILFQTGDINDFSFVVFFLVDMFNSNACFLIKKISAVKSETHFSKGAIKV